MDSRTTFIGRKITLICPSAAWNVADVETSTLPSSLRPEPTIDIDHVTPSVRLELVVNSVVLPTAEGALSVKSGS